MYNTTFSAEEEKYINEEVKKELDKDREALIEAEIANRVADARNSQPGYNGY